MRRSTIVFLLLFVLLLGAYYLIKYRKEAAPADVTSTPEATASQTNFLFDAADGVPTSISITSKDGSVVELARNAEGAWAIVKPVEAEADQGLAEAAASQVTAMPVQDKIQNVDLDILGLKTPEYVITVKFSSNVERKVEIGVLTPSETGYYIRNEQGEVVTVSNSSVEALLGLLTNPPYAATPTPEAPLPTPKP